MAEVRLENVTHRYPEAAADTLSGVSLTIARGEAHALLGGSGAGKTTLLNLLSGLLRPDAGAVVFDGRDVSAVPPRDRGVSQVFQFPVLYESLIVVDLLAFPLVNRGWNRADARARSMDVARRLGLQTRLHRRADALSLFEKQLVAIGRALVRPDIALVLLDEPLTAVEPATKWQLRRALKEAQRELGATMVYVTHDQTEALTFADRISVVHGGRILQTGTPQALYDEPDHEQVGHFIGSPGMNLVPGRVEAGAFLLASGSIGGADGLAEGVCTVGFRPEWAVLEAGAADGIPAWVTGTRVLGVRDHRPEGIVTADIGGHPVRTRQAIDVETGSRVRLRVDRALGFRDGVRMSAGAVERFDA